MFSTSLCSYILGCCSCNKVLLFGLWLIGTITKGAALLHQEGAREVYACSTHAVFRYVEFIWCMNLHFHSFGMTYREIFQQRLWSWQYPLVPTTINSFLLILYGTYWFECERVCLYRKGMACPKRPGGRRNTLCWKYKQRCECVSYHPLFRHAL